MSLIYGGLDRAINYDWFKQKNEHAISCKIEKILKCCLDLIPSPSPSVKIQIIGGKDCLRWKGPSNVLPYFLKQTFPPIIWIFNEGDGIESRLPFKIFSTLTYVTTLYAGLSFD